MSKYDKSPFNYIGGKYKMLPQLIPLFPDNINKMLDMFAGGGDVFANVTAAEIYANDINFFLIDIFRAFQAIEITELLGEIDKIIDTRELSMTNKESYLKFRSHYNAIPIAQRNPIELYVLMCYSFNYQFRFNSSHEFNNPFGRERSSFNPQMKENLIKFHKKLNGINFSSQDFSQLDYSFFEAGDFVYADPPYRITTGSYNDGKRGFKGWSREDDIRLFAILDELSERGVKFALSNVVEHKGQTNTELAEWMRSYNVHAINYDYNNSNYQAQNIDCVTREVLITNYERNITDGDENIWLDSKPGLRRFR